MTAAPKVVASGRLYYFTRCRVCISIRRSHPDAMYECVWCEDKKKLQDTTKPWLMYAKVLFLIMELATVAVFIIRGVR